MVGATDLVLAVRAGYLAAAFAIVIVFVSPQLRGRFLAYGARSVSPSAISTPCATANGSQSKTQQGQSSISHGPINVLLDFMAALQVPHSWFTSFYAVSVACSLFWATELIMRGPTFRLVVGYTAPHSASMGFPRVQLAWSMMFLQGSRRLYECLAYARPSTSQMWIGHWVLGIAFYTATSFALWIEGIPALRNHQSSFRDIALVAPGLRSFIGILVFILASGFQHDCHVYLTSLKDPSRSNGERKSTTYRVPTHPAFHSLIAPHYTAECLIYASLALAAAPEGMWVNYTLLCALVFVVVNLGVTANTSRDWYVENFGEASVAGKWSIIPGLY